MLHDEKVLVKLKSGERVIFSVFGYDEFMDLLRHLDGFFGKFICIGDNYIIRKDQVVSAYYFKDGYDGTEGDN